MELNKEYLEAEIKKTKTVIKQLEEALALNELVLEAFLNEIARRSP